MNKHVKKLYFLEVNSGAMVRVGSRRRHSQGILLELTVVHSQRRFCAFIPAIQADLANTESGPFDLSALRPRWRWEAAGAQIVELALQAQALVFLLARGNGGFQIHDGGVLAKRAADNLC